MNTSAPDWFGRLVEVVAVLRSPDGCPWDREQTLASLRPFVLEEAYEVLQAIDANDLRSLSEEIGDLIFEGVLLAQLCTETGHFSIADSLRIITEKLVRRHPHVFRREAEDAGVEESLRTPLDTGGEVLGRWEELKARERAEGGKRQQTLGGVPRTLPSLLRAYEIGSRAAAVGFDWQRAADVLDKIDEEVGELRRSVEQEADTNPARAEEEMGDLLFAIANLSRKLGIEPESALRRANDKFSRRFNEMERRFEARGQTLRGSSLDAMEDEWQKVKGEEHQGSGARDRGAGTHGPHA